jgi:long-chain acyl-CoA synthetase
MLLYHFLDESLASQPRKIALITEEASYTYADIGRMVAGLASALQQGGVKRGDRVGLFVPNDIEFVVGLFATLKVGGVFVPISPQIKAKKLAYMLRDCTPSGFVVDSCLEEVWREALGEAEYPRCLVIARSQDKARHNSQTSLAFAQVVSTEGELSDPGTIDQDLAAIIYTSGSTGDPKGVMLTHLNMTTAANSITAYLGLRQDDVILCALPLSFDYGLYQILMAFIKSARMILHRSFSFPVKILEAMEREGVTVFPGVPTMFSMLMALENLGRFNLSRLRMVTNTAAALSEAQIYALRRLFPQATLFSMYGLTECKRVTYLPPEQLDHRPSSVGRGMPNEEVYLVDETGRRLPHGSTGELVVRGSHVMRGYWRKPEETAKRLKPGPLPGEMVLYTGDIFRTDEEGYLYFVARKDDIIKTRGEKVAPREVENILSSLEGVLEAAVVGVEDPLLGEAIQAFLALRPGYTYTEREIIKYCLAHMESFMTPKYVKFLSSLPKSSNGKIDKLSLKHLYLTKEGHSHAEC